ncbi:Zn-dependent protease [Skermanella aerolata]|uniref:Zn-dependent protease n=1 Tax=Skermanella aerolata TaxID=393310 RepID=A0A512DJJ4_9PROT|nr:M48 family metallopeptidase [Skermanella aerolata]KJB97149.1 peptidase [Skermanella aerolata KACC 11604]GEO36643.1 Zn-dependent protease [Skermanella aerolata]
MCVCHGTGSHSDGTAKTKVTTEITGDRAAEMSRRGFMAVLVGFSGTALVACVGPGQTGLGLGLVSAQEAEQLGVQSWEQIRSEVPASKNTTYQRALQQVSTNILTAIGQNPANWEAVVFQSKEANAFALPGNKIGVYEGMFAIATDVNELAAVVGHEVGHNQAEHARERLSSAAATQTGVQLLGAALQIGNIGYANEIAGLLGAGVQYGLILPYSRNQELEADSIGLINMAKAGYDPRAAIKLWQNMQAAGERAPEFLSTHPAPESRIAALEAQMPEALSYYKPRPA